MEKHNSKIKINFSKSFAKNYQYYAGYFPGFEPIFKSALLFLKRVFPVLLAAQLAYITWQAVLFSQKPKLPTFAHNINHTTAANKWQWAEQETTKRVEISEPKTHYQFPGLGVKISGIIYKETGNSVVILSNHNVQNAILLVGESLLNGQILVDKINTNTVVFLESDKRFTVTWEDNSMSLLGTEEKSSTANKPHQEQQLKSNNDKPNDIRAIAAFSPKSKEVRDLAEDIITRPQKLLEYVYFVPIFVKAEMTGTKIVIRKRADLFAKMGIKSNDIIKAVDGKKVSSLGVNAMSYFKAKKSARLDILRNGKRIVIDVAF